MPGAAVPLLFKAAMTFAVKAAGSFVVKTVASYALGSALTAMSKKKAPAQERQAQVTKMSIGEVAREAVFGIAATGGSLVDVFNWGGQYGTDNVTFCIALADHACDGMQGYWVGDEYRPWTGNGAQAAFGGKLILTFRNARENGWAPPSEAVENGGWTATDRGCGVTHMWVTWISDDKVWPQGLPEFVWEVRGAHLADPRRGDHDLDDPETWTFSRNPILERNAFVRGIYATGRHGQPAHLLIGRGLSAEEAPPERIIASANLCDEDVDGLPRYYADGVISADMDFVEVEELFAATMAGVIVQREGGLEIEPGQARAAVVTITDDDLVVGEPIEFSEFRPDGDGGTVNTVIPRFTSVAEKYSLRSGAVRRDHADIIADGGPRELTLTMPLVTSPGQADRNAEIARRMARLEGRGGITLPPEFSNLEEGDPIAWTSARRFGGATRRFRIEAFSQNEAWRSRLTLREISATVFGGVDPVDDPVSPPPPTARPAPLFLDGVVISAIRVGAPEVEGGPVLSGIPGLRFQWNAPVDRAVQAVRAEVRTVGSPIISVTISDVIDWTSVVPEEGEVPTQTLDVTNGVGPGMDLEARLVAVGDPSRDVVDPAWTTVTIGGLVASDTTHVGTRPVAEVLGVVDATAAMAAAQSEAQAILAAAVLAVQGSQATLDAAVAAANLAISQAQSELDAALVNVATLQNLVSGHTSSLDGLTLTVSAHTTLINGKADLSQLNVQTLRIDQNVSAIGTLVTQVANLQTNSVTTTQFGTLLSEVTGARNGSANLAAQLSTMRQTVVDGLAGKASVSDLTTLSGRVTTAESTISGHSSRLTTVETDVAGRVRTSDFNTLSGIVTAHGNTLTSHASRLTTVETDVAGRAYASDFLNLLAEVSNARNGSLNLNAQLQTMRTATSDGLAGRATVTSVTNLTARVTTAEGTINGHAGRLTSVETAVAGRALLTDFNTLNTTVTNQGTTLTGVNDRLATVELALPGLALASTVNTLAVEIANARGGRANMAAYIQDVDQARLDGDTALASRASALEAQVDGSAGSNLRSRIISLETATTDGRFVSATTYNLLAAEIANARAGQPNLLATVAALQQARVDGDAAQAASTTALGVTVNGISATLTTVQGVASDALGRVNAKWGVVFNVDGYASGFSSVNNGTTSEMAFDVDKFKIGKPGGGERTEFANGRWTVFYANGQKAVEFGVLS